jgi:integrase
LLRYWCPIPARFGLQKWRQNGDTQTVKVSVQKATIRRKGRYVVSWKPLGKKRQRRYFKTKTEANTEAEAIRLEQAEAREAWLALTSSQRNEILGALNDAVAGGFTIRQAVDSYRATAGPDAQIVSLGDAYKQFIEEKQTMRVSPKTLIALKSNVGRFIQGRGKAALQSVTRDEVLTWLQRPAFAPRTFNTYRTSLGTFFRWCVDTDRLSKSPTAKIKAIDERQMPDLDVPPTILSVDQTKRLLKTALEIDKGLVVYIALGLFAGLRPEREAAQLAAEDIQGDLIYVRGMHAKDRQRRHVEMHSTLKAWLAYPTGHGTITAGGEFQPLNLRRRFERLREAAGLIRIEIKRGPNQGERLGRRLKLDNGKWRNIVDTGWGQDCLRHTFASHYLPIFGAEKTIEALGHGDYDMLFGHYRQLVKPDEAEKFWKLTPDNLAPESL